MLCPNCGVKLMDLVDRKGYYCPNCGMMEDFTPADDLKPRYVE